MSSLRGQFLIASPALVDPNFLRAVVLIVRHDEEGALGLVLNRPLEMGVSEVVEQVIEEPSQREGVLRQGGPCEGPLMVLHGPYSRTGPAKGPGEEEQEPVVEGVYFAEDRAQIEPVIRAAVSPALFFVGYAGWDVGQLEGEMKDGGWIAMPASAELVFGDETNLWQRLNLQLAIGRTVPVEIVPSDPEMN